MSPNRAAAQHHTSEGVAPLAGAMGGVARGGAANLLGAAVMAAASLCLTVAVTRGLSREAAGIFFSATSLFILATTVGQLGTNTALVYFLSQARSLGRGHLIHAYLRTALRPVLLTATVMAVVMFAAARPIASVTTPGHVEQTAGYLRVVALFIPLAGLENVTLAATRGLGTMRPSVMVEQVGRCLLQLVLVTAAVWVPGSHLIGWAWSVAYLPAAVGAYLWWRHIAARRSAVDHGVSVTLSSPSPRNRPLGWEFWRFSLPRALASVGQIAMQRLDIVLVGALSGPVQAAIYAAATRFLVVGQMGTRAISLAVQPKLGETLARDDKAGTNHLYQTSTAWLMLVTWPLYLTFVVFGSLLVGVFGAGYRTGQGALLILSCSMLLATGCGMVDMVLNMAGRTAWNLYNVLLALAVNVGLDLWLIPGHGVLGAAIGWAAAIALQNLVPLAQVGLVMGLHPFGRAGSAAALLTLTCFGLIPWVVRLGLGETWFAVVVAALVGGAAFAVGLWALRRPLRLTALRDIRRARTVSR